MKELEKYRKDSRYKKYVQLVEKILQSFDKEVNEWADFISFLGKLLKAFQSYPQFPVIPRKLIVAKRLAQSLNPALPPGVHQKALEVYDYIFDSIGTEQLADDLSIYAQGLFPFLQHASMSVKPQLLGIYEKYVFPLRARLRPVMKALLTALLPGLEEEGRIVEKSYFFHNMWLVLITSPVLRIPALHYLSRRMPKITSKEDVAVVLGDDVGIMVRAFSATLGDRNVLAQRAILDLLVINFPLKDKNLGEIMQQDDLILLMKSAASVVLRKDMSLNRRLYAWLLGPDDNPEQQTQYFQDYGKSAMVSALKKPFKILISLLDKWEIGLLLVEDLLIDILWSLKDHVEKSTFGIELLQTANMFLEMIDSYLIWMKLYGLVQNRLSFNDGLDTAALELMKFVLSSFKLHEEEIEKIHLPLFLTALLCKLNDFSNEPNFSTHISKIESALELALNLFKKIHRSVFNYQVPVTNTLRNLIKDNEDEIDSSMDSTEDSKNIQKSQIDLDFVSGMDPMKYINDFYSGNEKIANKKFSGIRGRYLAEELLKAIQGFLQKLITRIILVKDQDVGISNPGTLSKIMDCGCGLLRNISERVNQIVNQIVEQLVLMNSQENREENKEIILSKLYSKEWIDATLKCCYMVKNFNIIDSALSTLLFLIIDKRLISSNLLDTKHQIREIVDTLWSFLGPQHNFLHFRIVQLIWKLKDLSSANYVEAIISEYLLEKDIKKRVTNFEKFNIFWLASEEFKDKDLSFIKPMYLMLDTLRDEDPMNRRAGETWMRWNQKSILRILQPMIVNLLDATIIRQTTKVQIGEETFEIFYYEKTFNQARIDYIFTTLSSICRVGKRSFLKEIFKSLVKTEIISSCNWLPTEIGSSITYSELFIRTTLLYIESEIPDNLSTMKTLNELIHVHATEFLFHLIEIPEFVNINMVHLVHELILRKLFYCIHMKQLSLQARLIPLLHSTIINIGPLNECPVNGSLSLNSPINKKLPFDPIYSSSPSRYYRTAFLVKVLTEALSKSSNRPLLQEWMDLIINSLTYFRSSFNTVLVQLIQCICEQLRQWKSETQFHYALIDNNNDSNISESRNGEPAMFDWDIIIFLNGFEKIVKDCLNKHSIDDYNSSYASSKSYETTLGLPTLTGYMTGTFTFTLEYTGKRIKERIKKLLEELHKRAQGELVEAFVELWYIENPDVSAVISEPVFKDIDSTVIEVLKAIPGSSPTKIINTLLVSARSRTDIMILRFLEVYADSLKNMDPLIEAWPQCISYIKDYYAQASVYKYLFMHEFADRLCSSAYFEEKKVRKEMQDVYQRVLDYCILIAGRSFDQGLWLRRTLVQDGEDRNSSDETIDKESESGRLINTTIPEEKKISWKSKEEVLMEQINLYLANVIVPNLRRILADQDRITSVVTNIVYYIISSALKNRPNSGVNSVILDLLCEISKIPFVYRVWRKEAWDVFIDNRFFNMSPSAAKKWNIIMQTIMTSEKERFAEEYESLSRALNLRRLSYIIFCGKLDQYIKQLHSIAEKLVDLFKLGFAELVHAESSRKENIAEQHETANSFLAACKFLDLLFVLQTNDFQVYEWMFIADTINIINHSLELSPYALLDKLADHLSGQQNDISKLRLDNLSNSQFQSISPLSSVTNVAKTEYKRPMLKLKSISNIKQLEFFVRTISLYVYQSTYALAKPDIPYIESLLENDMLEYEEVNIEASVIPSRDAR
ncbi:8083_t:CDS:10 [Diversispora eburnea]|uniref:8083_t:CDS:1 n=1 Tax=Diversispora eburnea TaxID=1213867 RepID=A0A9N8W2V6_9GLOM|nr:8083_t:CDS:10 [Diversispora eburnea]